MLFKGKLKNNVIIKEEQKVITYREFSEILKNRENFNGLNP